MNALDEHEQSECFFTFDSSLCKAWKLNWLIQFTYGVYTNARATFFDS